MPSSTGFEKNLWQQGSEMTRVIICSHLPLDFRAASFSTCMFDCDEVLKVIHEDGRGAVVAAFTGHYHGGGYHCDEEGLHHVTVQSPLESQEGAYGWVEVFPDRLELVGKGAVPSRSMPFPKLAAIPTTSTPSSKL